MRGIAKLAEYAADLENTIKRVEQVLLFPPSTRRDSYEECDLCGFRYMHEGHAKTCLVARIRAALEAQADVVCRICHEKGECHCPEYVSNLEEQLARLRVRWQDKQDDKTALITALNKTEQHESLLIERAAVSEKREAKLVLRVRKLSKVDIESDKELMAAELAVEETGTDIPMRDLFQRYVNKIRELEQDSKRLDWLEKAQPDQWDEVTNNDVILPEIRRLKKGQGE